MSVKVFRTSEYLKMLWKNGLGYTLQLACSHPTIEYFDWRISIADVEQNSVFSLFRNKFRIISILQGNGLILKNQNAKENIHLSLNEIYCFSGDDSINSSLLDGTIRDFNLIYNPKKHHAKMDWHHLSQYKLNIKNAEIFFIFNANKRDLNIKVNNINYTLKEYELLKIEQNNQLNIKVNSIHKCVSYYTIELHKMHK